jgi:predicted MFS family arabinose efflux permease
MTASDSRFPPRPDRHAPPLRTALAGLIGMAAAMGIGRFVYTPILPQMMAEAGVTTAQAGLIASANYVGYLAGAILAAYGWASGREKAIVLLGLAANAGLLLAMGFADTVTVFGILRLLAGFASAFVMVFGATIVLSHGAAAGRPFVQSVHFAGVGIGMALSSVMVGALAAGGLDWRAGWIGATAIALLTLPLVAALMPAQPIRPDADRHEPPLQWSGSLRRLTVAYGIFGFGYIITATFLVAIVRQGGGTANFQALVWFATGAAAAGSVAMGHPFVRRYGLAAVFVGGCVVEAFGVAASVLVPLPFGPLIGGVLLGGTFVMVTAYGLQLGRVFAPQSPRRAFAFMTAAFGIGQIAGPITAGYLVAWSGDHTLANLAAAASLLLAAGLVGSIEIRRAGQ